MLSEMISSVKAAEKEADDIVRAAEENAETIVNSAKAKADDLKAQARKKADEELSAALNAVRAAAAKADADDDERTAEDVARLKAVCKARYPELLPQYIEVVFS